MDESLALALRVFFVAIEPRVADPPTERALEKVDEVLSRVADGDVSPGEAASFIRDVVKVLA